MVPEENLLPLDRARWFGADVVYDAGHAADFVDDAGRDALEDLSGETNPVGGHGGLGFDDADGYGEAIGAVVAHNSDATDGQQDGEGLPNFTIEPGATYLLNYHRVSLLQGEKMLAGDLAKEPYS